MRFDRRDAIEREETLIGIMQEFPQFLGLRHVAPRLRSADRENGQAMLRDGERQLPRRVTAPAVGARECETAPKWDPTKNRFKPLISNHKCNLRGVPICADWDPC
jgi:hypothetical protein